MSRRERDALLAFVAWWHGERDDFSAGMWRIIWDVIPDSEVGDSVHARWHAAESLAYDGTDGP